MKVAVFGGTGLIGYHAASELRARGHDVTVVARRAPAEGCLASGATLRTTDALHARVDLRDLLRDQVAVVLALGPDDRRAFPHPAYDILRAGIVDLTNRVLLAARREGVRHVVICGSYFTRLFPEGASCPFGREAPYIRARREQAARVIGETQVPSVLLLELPFVLGAAPGRTPLWAPVVRYARSRLPLLAVSGGTTMVGVRTVARAIANACEHRVPTGAYPLGDDYMSWTDWLEVLAGLAGRPRRARRVPAAPLRFFTTLLERWTRARGLQHGIERGSMVRVVTGELRIDDRDLAVARQALGIETHALDDALAATVAACP